MRAQANSLNTTGKPPEQLDGRCTKSSWMLASQTVAKVAIYLSPPIAKPDHPRASRDVSQRPVLLVGDSLWVRCIIGISLAPQVGWLYNAAMWDFDARVGLRTLVTEIKPNIFSIWPKTNTLISSFNFFLGGVRGLAVKIMTPMGCLTALGVISSRRLARGSYPCGCFKMLKWLSDFIFVFDFWINI